MCPQKRPRDDLLRLRHIVDHAREAVAFLRGRPRGDLDTDRMLQLATARLASIISEAAARVTREGQATHPAIPWVDLIALRARLLDGHFAGNTDILWRTVHDNLPVVIANLEIALPDHTD